jgi:hypothetical protein
MATTRSRRAGVRANRRRGSTGPLERRVYISNSSQLHAVPSAPLSTTGVPCCLSRAIDFSLGLAEAGDTRVVPLALRLVRPVRAHPIIPGAMRQSSGRPARVTRCPEGDRPTTTAMPDRPQIADSIVRRLTEASEEIASLQAARAVLTAAAKPPSRSSPGVQRSGARGARAKAARQFEKGSKGSSTPARRPAAPSLDSSSAAVKVTDRSPVAPRRRSRGLAPGQIEDLLRESPDGLSATALVKQTEGSAAKVRDRLRELERSGEARQSGSGRTSVWRLLSDEDRIAARAAELRKATTTGKASGN